MYGHVIFILQICNPIMTEMDILCRMEEWIVYQNHLTILLEGLETCRIIYQIT